MSPRAVCNYEEKKSLSGHRNDSVVRTPRDTRTPRHEHQSKRSCNERHYINEFLLIIRVIMRRARVILLCRTRALFLGIEDGQRTYYSLWGFNRTISN